VSEKHRLFGWTGLAVPANYTTNYFFRRYEVRLTRFVALTVLLVLAIAVVMPVAAQDVAPGEGGTIIESNIGDDPSTFNPIISSDTASSDVHDWMYPDIISLDPVSLTEAPGAPDGLAESWEYDETGTVLTLHLRQDLYWSDGDQITAEDYLWSFNAVASGQTTSARTYVMYQLEDGTITEGVVHDIEALDDFTLRIRLGNVATDEEGNPIQNEDGSYELVPNCQAISDLNDIPVVPSHVFEEAFGSDYSTMDADPYFVPETEGGTATFGQFTDPFIEFGVQVSLVADQNYPDASSGQITPGEWLYQNVEDQTVEFERFLAGDYSLIEVSANNQNAIRENPDFQIIEYPSNGYTFMGYNLADRNNPLPGTDENGNVVEQGMHPLFGDVRVRQALAHAVDVISMIGSRPEGDQQATGILEGNGYPIATHNHPGLSSTTDELEALGVAPYEFNPELALSMLAEAGWSDADGNGTLECNGCLYATEVDPAYEGTEFEFELLTNAGNVIRESAGETIKSQLAEIGITVNYQAIEFGTLVDTILSQQYDAIILGWNLGLPFTPDMKWNLGVAADRPEAGFNTGSYFNQEFEDLLDMANALPAAEDGSYPACDPQERDNLYAQAQKLVWEDQPYLFLYAANTMFAAQGDLAGWDPVPYNVDWNIDAWSVGN
jgi:peptide/nickel transport system substrate-binding protein